MESLLLSVHKDDQMSPPIPMPCVPFEIMFQSAQAVREARGHTPPGQSPDLKLKTPALMNLSKMRNALRMVCDPEQGLTGLIGSAGPRAADQLVSSAAASAMGLSSAALGQLANSQYGDLRTYEKRLDLMRQYVVQWTNLVSNLQFRRDRARVAVLPWFAWRSGVDGRLYGDTSLAFEGVMAGQLLACNLYNVQQRLDELTNRVGGGPPSREGVQHLYLSHTAECYRVLMQVVLESLVRCKDVLCREALIDRTRTGYAAALGTVRRAPPASLPPECNLELVIARLSQCLVRMHHHNSKRLLACVLRRTNRKGERREAGYVPATSSLVGAGESAEAPGSRASSSLMWTEAQLEQANALDVALSAQWTLRQLNLLEYNLARASLPAPAQSAFVESSPGPVATSLPTAAAVGLVQAAAARAKSLTAAGPGASPGTTTEGTGNRGGRDMDGCVPRLEPHRVEAYLTKQYSLAIFLQECYDEFQECGEDEALLRQQVGAYAQMYGGGTDNEAMFWSLARMNHKDVQLLQLRLMEDAWEELKRHHESAWSAKGIRDMWRRGILRRRGNGPDGDGNGTPALDDADELPAEEQIEDARAREDLNMSGHMAGGEDEDGGYETSLSERLGRAEQAERDRDRLGLRAEQLTRATSLESAMVGLLRERCERMRERLMSSLSILSLDVGDDRTENGKRIRRFVKGMSSLFVDGNEEEGAAGSHLFYGYRIQPLERFAARLCLPYLQELAAAYPPLGFV